MNSFVILYSTFEKQKHAQKVASHLLEKKLIACAVLLPAQSMYWWKGSITASPETVLIAKTTKSLAVKAKKELDQKHPYEVPCILEWSAKPNQAYWNWVLESTQKTKKPKKK